ncbi:MAG: TetR/AcrR family transcriptional regulator [Chitinophagaceae bacterium]|nr:TetR/AcrR family transcriptional regulator [Chitinophagaceae bacterium]MCW5929098.1 TetR/AcrR family transcriptional regulator [Chitinophagaceae bacterium]
MTRKEKDITTEEKIKGAARKVFTQKGYAATRTRDIAEEAGINLALLNYYFRSKEKLFELVMAEKVGELFGMLVPVVVDHSTTLKTKMEKIAATYIDTLEKNPGLPLFVLSEIHRRPEWLSQRVPIADIFKKSSFMQQVREKRPDIDPMHFFMNALGLCVFPFISSPVFIGAGVINRNDFKKLLQERKSLIPVWMNAMLKA